MGQPKGAPLICGIAYDAYLEKVKQFHGYAAPGLLLGGFLVDLAYRHLPKGGFFDAICETRACLPDAIQLLSPCTIGNGWLKVIDMGRYALAFYEKTTGKGIRVFVDPPKLDSFPEVKNWFFKLTPKKEQDTELLLDEIRKAGSAVCSVETVKVKPDLIGVTHRKGFVVCPQCKEAYPLEHGPICLGCRGDSPYLPKPGDESNPSKPALRAVPLEAAEGLHALCDMTEIIPGVQKGPAFKRHHRIAAEDICRLQKMGRQSVYVAEGNPDDPNWIHEDEAASAFARAMAGEGVGISKQPSEGKMEMFARQGGLFLVDAGRLEAFNLLAGMKCAARHGFTVTAEGTKLAGVRAIPLFLSRDEFEKGMKVLSAGPLFRVVPMRKARVGILVTGTEVFQGLVKDRFIPVKTLRKWGTAACVSIAISAPFRIVLSGNRNTFRGKDRWES